MTKTVILSAAILTPMAWSQVVVTNDIRTGVRHEIEGTLSNFKVMTFGGIEGRTVTGAPYAAEETTQTTQALADGNRIVNTTKTKVYRDQSGRRRVEVSLGNIGGLTGDGMQNMITIDDPVANLHYTLHPSMRTAEKVETNFGPGDGMPIETAQRRKEAMEMVHSRAQAGMTVESRAIAVLSTPKELARGNTHVEEDLGTRNMEGLMVQGKRTVNTIPAGAIGNEMEMRIVEEQWYSPELQMNVMTKHTDPRMGETVFTVNNVSRANPDLSLFQLPADYQVNSSKNMVYKFTRSTSP